MGGEKGDPPGGMPKGGGPGGPGGPIPGGGGGGGGPMPPGRGGGGGAPPGGGGGGGPPPPGSGGGGMAPGGGGAPAGPPPDRVADICAATSADTCTQLCTIIVMLTPIQHLLVHSQYTSSASLVKLFHDNKTCEVNTLVLYSAKAASY